MQHVAHRASDEVADLRLRLAETRQREDDAQAEIARLRAELMDALAEKAEMQDDLDAAHRLLGLAPYPLTA